MLKKSDLKVGDKVYCYKTSNFVFTGSPIHREGNTYENIENLNQKNLNINKNIDIQNK